MAKPTTGRPSIFRGKDKQRPIRAYLNPEGRRAFDAAREALAKVVGWEPAEVSEGDTVQWMAIGRPGMVKEADGTYRPESASDFAPLMREVRRMKSGGKPGGKKSKGGKKSGY